MHQAPPQEGLATFRATILVAGTTATGICVPDEAVERLNAGKRARVLPIEGAKTDETRLRRSATAVATLREERV
jgi:hypothetical protein